MNQYSIERKENVLIFKTGAFKVEKRSFLHSGVFTRELASSFVASGIALLYLLSVALFHGMPGYPPDAGLWQGSYRQYAVAVIIFLVTFPLCRAFLFRERSLRVMMDREHDEISVSQRGLLRKRVEIKMLTELKDILVNSVLFEPKNPDAVDFVGRIALQHGTVMPGLGQADRLYTIDMIFDDERITVFASKSEKDAGRLRDELRVFAFWGDS